MKSIRATRLFILLSASAVAISLGAGSVPEPVTTKPSPAHVASRPFVIDPQYDAYPTADGWKEFTAAPHLGNLDHAMTTVPTPHGNIEVSADRGGATVVVPAGNTLVVSVKRHPGPCRVSLPAE